MRERLSSFVLASLLACCFASGALYDGWTLIGEKFTVDGQQFVVTGSSVDYDLIVLSTPSGSVSLGIGKYVVNGGYSYQFLHAMPNSTYKDLEFDMTDPHLWNEPYRFHILMDKFEGSLEVQRATDQEVFYGGLLNVTVVLKNTGDADLPVQYSEPIRPIYRREGELYFTTDAIDTYRVSQPSGTVSWKGTVPGGKETKLQYTYKLIGYSTGSANASLNPGKAAYTYLDEQQEVSVPETVVKLKSPVEVTLEFSKDNILLNRESETRVKVLNLYPGELDVKMVMRLPSTVNPKYYYDIIKVGDHFEWSGRIREGGEQSFEIPMIAHSSGIDPLEVDVEYSYLEYSAKESFRKDFTVSVEPIEILLGVSESSIMSYDPFFVNFSGINRNRGIDFRNLHLTLSSGLFPAIEKTYPSVRYNVPFSIENSYYQAPWVFMPTNYNISLTGAYETENGQELNVNITKVLYVRPLVYNKTLDIKDAQIFRRNDTLSINVTLIKTSDANIANTSLIIATIAGNQIAIYSLTSAEGEALVSRNYSSILMTAKAGFNVSEYDVVVSYDENSRTLLERKKADYFELPNFTQANLTGILSKPAENQSQPENTSRIGELIAGAVNMRGRAGIVVAAVLGSLVFTIICAAIYLHFSSKKTQILHTEEYHQQIAKKPEPDHIEETDYTRTPSPSTNLEYLDNYIQFYKGKGVSREKLREALLKNGWLQEIVDVYLK